ncbi:hypothetical protein GOV06_02840, partial [Candidatus Woesearchaeota archaeon]|nr:hypothetical protein [Candidatus Woesearchaeota archaeon]
MENENQKFQEAVDYFNQKLKEAGVEELRIDCYQCDDVLLLSYLLPESDTGRSMTLFMDLKDPIFLRGISGRAETLAEIVDKGSLGHVLVQSDGCN